MFTRLVKCEQPSLQQELTLANATREQSRQEFVRDYVMNALSGRGALTSFQLRTVRDNANEMFHLMYPVN